MLGCFFTGGGDFALWDFCRVLLRVCGEGVDGGPSPIGANIVIRPSGVSAYAVRPDHLVPNRRMRDFNVLRQVSPR